MEVAGGVAAGGLAILAVIVGILTAIFWMVVGWRAMRAHERLADAAEHIAHTYWETNPPRVGSTKR